MNACDQCPTLRSLLLKTTSSGNSTLLEVQIFGGIGEFLVRSCEKAMIAAIHLMPDN